jgi:hypothetical protein
VRSLKTLAQPGLPIWTVIVVLYLQFAFYNAFTVFETIGTSPLSPLLRFHYRRGVTCPASNLTWAPTAGTPYTQHAYGWSVTTNGFMFAGIGGGCIVSLVILQVGAMLFQDRTLLLVTEVLMAGGFGLLIQWPFDEYVCIRMNTPSNLVGQGLHLTFFCIIVYLFLGRAAQVHHRCRPCERRLLFGLRRRDLHLLQAAGERRAGSDDGMAQRIWLSRPSCGYVSGRCVVCTCVAKV